MIRGFIEHKQSGLDEQGPGQRDAHAPAAGEILRGSSLHLAREPKTSQNPLKIKEPSKCSSVGDPSWGNFELV